MPCRPARAPGSKSYAAGVNAWLKDDDQQYGLELTLIKLLSGGRYRPEPWRPADSLVWGKLMALGLDGNWRAELLRLRSRPQDRRRRREVPDRAVGRQRRRHAVDGACRPTQGIDLDRLYPRHRQRSRRASARPRTNGCCRARTPCRASRCSPTIRTSALTFPGVWYLARLVGPGFDIRGASSPGSPAIVLGHNGTIGWGFTTTNLDSQDLFVERVDPTDPGRYITPDGARPFAVRDETIKVLWGEPVPMRVRQTRHGVVIDDFLARRGDPAYAAPAGHVLALQATALDGADTSARRLRPSRPRRRTGKNS